VKVVLESGSAMGHSYLTADVSPDNIVAITVDKINVDTTYILSLSS
jgi:hypothetical protein